MTPHETVKQALELFINTHFYNRSLCEDIKKGRESLALLDTHTLVPNEPTEEMAEAGRMVFEDTIENDKEDYKRVFKAMAQQMIKEIK